MSLHRLLLVSLITAVSIQSVHLNADDTDAPKPTRVNRPLTAFFPGWSPTQQRIHAALDDKTTINFNDTPLIDGIQFLAKQHDINIAIDVPALEESGITTDEPINVVLSSISLRSALRIVLANLQLDYVLRNEVMMITTLERAGTSYATRVYPVSDLVSRENDESWDELVDALHATAGTEWATEKTPGGSVAIVRKAGCLVVSQTYRGHDEVFELLTSLRDAQRFETSWDELIKAVRTTATGNWNSVGDSGAAVAAVPTTDSLVIRQNDRGHEEVIRLSESLRSARAGVPSASQHSQGTDVPSPEPMSARCQCLRSFTLDWFFSLRD